MVLGRDATGQQSLSETSAKSGVGDAAAGRWTSVSVIKPYQNAIYSPLTASWRDVCDAARYAQLILSCIHMT